MSDQTKVTDLARRYLDLWDRQAQAMAGEPDWAAVMQRWLTDLEKNADADGHNGKPARRHGDD